MDISKVSFGWTSIIGYASSAIVTVKLAIHSIEVGQLEAAAAGNNKWLALYTIVTVAVVTFIRGEQAKAKIIAGASK